MKDEDKAGTKRKSLGALLLHGGDWNGIRIMGLGERLAVIGVSAVTALCVAGPASYFLCRGEMRRDPGSRDGDGNRRDGGCENRVEALQEPSAEAPAPFAENILAGRVDVQDAHGVDATGKFDGGAGDEALSAEVQRGGVVIPREVKGDVARTKRVGGAENPIVPFVHGSSIAQPR